MPQINNFEILKQLVESKLEVTERIKKELDLLSDAPDFIIDSFLKAYQAIIIDKTTEPTNTNECDSQIAFQLGITINNPENKSFHYYVNPSSVPDIDLDFADNSLPKNYVREKYPDCVASIGTYGKYKVKSLLKDLTRLFKDENGNRLIPLIEVNQLAKKLNIKIDSEVDLEEETEDDLISFDNEHILAFERKYPYVFEHFKNLYGIPKYSGVHAAGVVITNEPIRNLIPLKRAKGEIVTEYIEGQGASELSSVGVIKMDFLGLSTLRVLTSVNQMIIQRYSINENSVLPCNCEEKNRTCESHSKFKFITRKNEYGETIKLIDLDNLCLHMPAIYENICQGKTEGVFQLEPGGITEYTKSYEPREFYDLALITSLYRPGAMDCHLDEKGIPIDEDEHPYEYSKAPGAHEVFVERRHGRVETFYTSEKVKPLLEKSYGIASFQESLSQIITAMTGCSFAEAEDTRKFFTKFKPKLLLNNPDIAQKFQKIEDKYFADCEKNGCTKKEAQDTWQMILPFSRYGFNKSHAVSYSIITYETAFFRTFYPLEYFTCLLIHAGQDSKILDYIRTAQKEGITVRKPNINKSFTAYTINSENEIVAGLTSIKSVGEKSADLIIKNREEQGEFTSLEDFLGRNIEWRNVNVRVLEALVKAGAFDSLCDNRALTLAKILITKGKTKISDYEIAPENDVFGEVPKEVKKLSIDNLSIPEWDNKAKIAFEHECFGFRFEDTLKDNFKQITQYFNIFKKIAAKKLKDARIGMIHECFVKPDKNGNEMAFITIKDLESKTEKWIIFSSIYKEFKNKILKKESYFAFGRKDEKFGSFVVEGLEPISGFIETINKVKQEQEKENCKL